MGGHQTSVVAGRRQDEHRVDAANVGRAGHRVRVPCGGLVPDTGTVRRDRRPLLVALADDRLERVSVGLDLEQDGIVATIQAKIGRPKTRPRDGRLDSCPPARVSHPDQRFDDPGVRGVVDERRRVGVDAETEVGAQDGGRAGADSIRHSRVAGLDAADRRSVDADGSSDRSLADACPKPDQAELLPETGSRSSELPIAFVDRCPAGRGMGRGCRTARRCHRSFPSEHRPVLPAVQQMALNGVLPGP
jgi:hypothetical protein